MLAVGGKVRRIIRGMIRINRWRSMRLDRFIGLSSVLVRRISLAATSPSPKNLNHLFPIPWEQSHRKDQSMLSTTNLLKSDQIHWIWKMLEMMMWLWMGIHQDKVPDKCKDRNSRIQRKIKITWANHFLIWKRCRESKLTKRIQRKCSKTSLHQKSWPLLLSYLPIKGNKCWNKDRFRGPKPCYLILNKFLYFQNLKLIPKAIAQPAAKKIKAASQAIKTKIFWSQILVILNKRY